jgi:hypothetical protein
MLEIDSERVLADDNYVLPVHVAVTDALRMEPVDKVDNERAKCDDVTQIRRRNPIRQRDAPTHRHSALDPPKYLGDHASIGEPGQLFTRLSFPTAAKLMRERFIIHEIDPTGHSGRIWWLARHQPSTEALPSGV